MNFTSTELAALTVLAKVQGLSPAFRRELMASLSPKAKIVAAALKGQTVPAGNISQAEVKRVVTELRKVALRRVPRVTIQERMASRSQAAGQSVAAIP